MELVFCDEHRDRCLLKTGVRDGPNRGKSFYVCGGMQGSPCGFIQQTDIPPSHCLHHSESMVELQALVQAQHSYRLFFRCVLARSEGKKWCGSVPWKEVEVKEKTPPLEGESDSYRFPQQRNPFKAPCRTGQPSEWRIVQEGGSGRQDKGDKTMEGEKEREGRKEEGDRGNKNRVRECKSEKGDREKVEEKRGRESRKGGKAADAREEEKMGKGESENKEGERDDTKEKRAEGEARKSKNEKEKGWNGRRNGEGEEGRYFGGSGAAGEPWRGRELPAGMRLKKRASGEEVGSTTGEREGVPSARSTDIRQEGTVEPQKDLPENTAAQRHAGKSSKEAERHAGKSSKEAERHAGKSSKEAEWHAGKCSEEAERHAGKSSKEAERHAGKSCKEAEQHAGKCSEEAEQHAGKSSKEAERHAGKCSEEAEQHAGKCSKEAERHAGKSSKEAERNAGKSSKEAERHAGKSSKEAERHAGKSSKEAEQHAGKSSKEAERHAGKSSKEAERHAGKCSEEAEVHDGKETGRKTECESRKWAGSSEGDVTLSRTRPPEASAHRLLEDSDDDDDDDDEVQLVSVQPGPTQLPPQATAPVQKTLTAFPGFQRVTHTKSPTADPHTLHSELSAQLKKKKATLAVVNVSALPDKGERLKTQVKDLEDALASLSLTAVSHGPPHGPPHGDPLDVAGEKHGPAPSLSNPFARPGGTILLPEPAPLPAPSSALGLQPDQGSSLGCGAQAFYGGRMTDSRLLAVKNATAETIDHLHLSLESCPAPHTEAPDPQGIRVLLLPHQKQALAWLLWRETQRPCGGILADDMGLGKTLTIIALILAQRKTKEEEEEKEGWISKTDPALLDSQGTLVICPASLIHHWKKEIERHVKRSRLSVYLYHGPSRQKSARMLAVHDVVVTTYSLVSKEIPVQKDSAEKPCQDTASLAVGLSPLLQVSWARLVLDEAHNIKNPKVQTSLAVCQLRARARWAVTGTPIQNNLLDMYSLLKFLRCSPFDEYKLWKAQVDNGSKRGGERLSILTRALLLRRTKTQLDSSGKPLVSLPDRTCEVHRVKLSTEEQSVYDVVFAQSRSTLQSYLKRHEGGDTKKESTVNPFEKVAREFGVSQSDSLGSAPPAQASSAVHILSLLLRLRQCCCHLSLLKKTLDQAELQGELQGEGISLSLEEQLSALCLSDASGPHPKDTVSLNGNRFSSELFQETRESTKISAVLAELKAIGQGSGAQKSVIVSQWTSMLGIVAGHLRRLGLPFATIDGTVNPKKRMELVEEFNTNPKGPQVMLVSLCAGGVGINLTGGNHLFLLDMHWNPALEDQACDRIYRVGQLRNVTIHRFVCDGTVEDKISSLQERKKELASKVLSGTGSSVTKLSLADLRVIFGI